MTTSNLIVLKHFHYTICFRVLNRRKIKNNFQKNKKNLAYLGVHFLDIGPVDKQGENNG